MNNLNFGQALEALKQGEALVRAAWWKGYYKQFVFMFAPDEWNSVDTQHSPSTPQCVKDWFSKDPNKSDIQASSLLSLKDENERIIHGWTPSQEDMFAEDWMVLNIGEQVWCKKIDAVSVKG